MRTEADRTISDLRGQLIECNSLIEMYREAAPRLQAQLRSSAEEIERLREALETICNGPRDADKSYPELFAEDCGIARAALATPTTGPHDG